MVAEFREKLTASKQVAQKFNGERFNLKKLNELEVETISDQWRIQMGVQLWRT